jgi:ribulose-5-phosphate 4-epimerase/fuculose-1-phosphate aldolase
MHTHTVAGAAVSAMECGLLPVTLESMLFTGSIGYHDFEGITVQGDEKPRLVKALGNNVALILRNHGLLTVGRTVAEAFLRMFHLQRACEVQVAALQAGVKLTLPPRRFSGAW